MTMWTCIAVPLANPSTQGEIRTQRPMIKFSHSSQTASAAKAAIDITAMITPLTKAFVEAAPPENPKIQGDTKRIAPRIRLATSQSLALLHSFMTFLLLAQRPISPTGKAAIRLPKFVMDDGVGAKPSADCAAHS